MHFPNFVFPGIVIFSILFFSACSDDETATPDNQDPSVNIISPTASTEVWNTVIIEIAAEDDEGLDRVEVYVDNESLGTLTEAPFEVNWNTRELEERNYSIKAVAFGQNGNSAEAITEVTVNNTLFSLIIEQGHFKEHPVEVSERWIVISSDAGHHIEVFEVKDGESYQVERPANFNDSTISITSFHYYKPNPETEYHWMTTYSKVKPQEWRYRSVQRSTQLGFANFKFLLDGNPNLIAFSAKNGGSFFARVSEPQYSAGIGLKQNGVDFYSAIWPQDGSLGKYGWVRDVSVGQTYFIDQANLNGLLTEATIKLPFETDFHYDLLGVTDLSDGSNYYVFYESSFNSPLSDFQIQYPKDEFPFFQSVLHFQQGDENYSIRETNSEISKVFEKPKITITVNNHQINDFEATFKGDFDLISTAWGYNHNSDNFKSFSWAVLHQSTDNLKYRVFYLPQAFSERYPFMKNSKLEYWSTQVTEYPIISSLAEYLDYQFRSEEKFLLSNNSVSVSQSPGTSSGRLKGRSLKPGKLSSVVPPFHRFPYN